VACHRHARLRRMGSRRPFKAVAAPASGAAQSNYGVWN
jgi:hypothetical protein